MIGQIAGERVFVQAIATCAGLAPRPSGDLRDECRHLMLVLAQRCRGRSGWADRPCPRRGEFAGQDPVGQRAPRGHGQAEGLGHRQQLALDVAAAAGCRAPAGRRTASTHATRPGCWPGRSPTRGHRRYRHRGSSRRGPDHRGRAWSPRPGWRRPTCAPSRCRCSRCAAAAGWSPGTAAGSCGGCRPRWGHPRSRVTVYLVDSTNRSRRPCSSSPRISSLGPPR